MEKESGGIEARRGKGDGVMTGVWGREGTGEEEDRGSTGEGDRCKIGQSQHGIGRTGEWEDRGSTGEVEKVEQRVGTIDERNGM